MNKADSLDKETSEGTAISESKRALLRSAWVAPVVIAVTLPKSGYAANISSSGRPNEGGDSKPKSDNGNHFGQLKKNP